MNFYKIHYLSLMKFLNLMAVEIGSATGVTPAVLNFDAHSNITELPKQDMIGLVGFGLVKTDKLVTVHTGFGISTYDDPNILRHIDIVDLLSKQVDIGSSIPLYTAAGTVVSKESWMVSSATLLVEPCDNAKLRTFQVMTIQFQSGMSGRA
jgi:hypothetical protein